MTLKNIKTMKNTLIIEYDFKQKIDGYYYSEKRPNIRFYFTEDEDPIFGGVTADFVFEIFKRPYFFGMIGKKKWEFICQTNGWKEGISFCSYLLLKYK